MQLERVERFAALKQLLDSWDERFGPVSAESAAAAKAAFDELDGIVGPEVGRPAPLDDGVRRQKR